MDHYIQTSHKMMLPATMQQGSWYQAMAKPSSESSRNTSRKCRPAGHDLSRHGHGQKAHEGFRSPKKKRGAEELRENRERHELESLGNKPVAMLVSSCGGRAGWMPLWHCWMYFILYVYIYLRSRSPTTWNQFLDVTWCDCMLNMFEYLSIPSLFWPSMSMCRSSGSSAHITSCATMCSGCWMWLVAFDTKKLP
jgi:hypothetical protein